jgi:hypothetical protein
LIGLCFDKPISCHSFVTLKSRKSIGMDYQTIQLFFLG